MFDLDTALGIEIRGDRLFLALVSKGFRSFTVRKCGIVANFRELAPAELRGRVRQILEEAIPENIVLGLPRDQAVVRKIELPLEVEENLEQVVRFQVQRFEPVEEDRSYYDYLVLQRDEQNKRILIELIMVRASILDGYLTLFQESHLFPAAVRLSTSGLYALFSVHQDGYPKKEPCLVLNIQPEAVEMGLLAASSRFFTESLAMPEGLTADALVEELGLFLSRVELQEEGISKIYFASASSLLGEFQERFGSCELLSEKMDLRQKDSLGLDLFVDAIGLGISAINRLAVTRFNLIPSERRMFRERPTLAPTLVLAGLLMVLALSAGTAEYFQRRRLMGQVEAQMRVRQAQVDEVMVMREQIESRRLELAELKNTMKGRQKVLMAMKELTEKLPDSTFLGNMNIQGDKVNVTGWADSASTLLTVLLNSQYFKSVENRYITPDPGMGKEKFNFELTMKE